MPTEAEVKVMNLLNAIEVPPSAGAQVEEWGNAAVTVVCEAALGSYLGLRQKVRTNAVALLGFMNHPQARETAALLVASPDPDVAIRAMRASGRQDNKAAVERLGELLERADAPPLLAAEALKALASIGGGEASAKVEAYVRSSRAAPAHRDSAVVRSVIDRMGPR